jgi:REP element-mobilizing transposase RayT
MIELKFSQDYEKFAVENYESKTELMNIDLRKDRKFDTPIYYISTETHNKTPFFHEDIFCEILLGDLKYGSILKDFRIFGYKILPESTYLIIQPRGYYDCEKSMQNVKRASSLHINQIMGFVGTEGGNIYSRLEWKEDLIRYKDRFVLKYGEQRPFKKFQWADSFKDEIIGSVSDFREVLDDLLNKWNKHKQRSNTYCFVDYELCGKYVANRIV